MTTLYIFLEVCMETIENKYKIADENTDTVQVVLKVFHMLKDGHHADILCDEFLKQNEEQFFRIFSDKEADEQFVDMFCRIFQKLYYIPRHLPHKYYENKYGKEKYRELRDYYKDIYSLIELKLYNEIYRDNAFLIVRKPSP